MKYYQPYFIFNGIDSRLMGVIVTAMPPTVRAAERVDTYTVAGRSGSLHEKDGAFDNYTKTMECAIRDRKKIDEIAQWLTGSGEIIFSSEPDKVYRVNIINTISISQMLRTFQKFMVTFDTYPFKYSVNAFDEAFVLTAPANVLGRGTIYSQPIITIYGSGDIVLNINGNAQAVNDVDEYVTINSEIVECYKDNVNMNNSYVADSFPQLEVGENAINWTGNVDKIDIIPSWRWL